MSELAMAAIDVAPLLGHGQDRFDLGGRIACTALPPEPGPPGCRPTSLRSAASGETTSLCHPETARRAASSTGRGRRGPNHRPSDVPAPGRGGSQEGRYRSHGFATNTPEHVPSMRGCNGLLVGRLPRNVVPPRVFISYSHDSIEHRALVFTLSQQLRHLGVDCWLDQYDEVPPPQSWPLWMFRHVDESDYVLVVCTSPYRRRVEGREKDRPGHGARWEGAVITQELYERPRDAPVKFIPVLLAGTDDGSIPYFLRSTTHYSIDVDRLDTYRSLLEHLLGRPRVRPAPLGTPPADLAQLRLHPKLVSDRAADHEVVARVALAEIGLLALLGAGSLDPERLLERWSSSSTSSAPVVVGMGEDGAVTWDLVTEGPHALVAGTTGSGKSSFLQSILASIALTYAPTRWTFLLVDYKGGAAFAELRELPHSLGLLTNIDAHEVRRLSAALHAELDRRMDLLRQAGAGSFEELQRRSPEPPLARLLIVVDEFAALVHENPEFVELLLEVGRAGRSLGVHLVLATQRPSGAISDELRASIAVRFALRVASPADSEEVLGSSVAAELPYTPGLVYMSSLGGTPVLFRSAYAGVEDGTLGRVVASVTAAASRSGRHRPVDSDWVRGLPSAVSLSMLWSGHDDVEVALGLQDEPGKLVVGPWSAGARPSGHLHVIGTSGSGKSTVLRTIASAAARLQLPQDLEIYTLGFGPDRSLRAVASLANAKYVGDATSPVDAMQILRIAEGEAARRTLALERKITAMRMRPGATLLDLGPALLLIVDDLHRLLREDREAGPLLERLAASPAAVGVDLLVSTDLSAALMPPLRAFERKLVLRLSSVDDYQSLGVAPSQLPGSPPPGRGILMPEGREVQVGFVGIEPSVAGQAEGIAAIGRRRGDHS